ncbi:MAG TPA: hypothetical protein PLS95_01130 [Thermoanaerobaculales bacterium]|nr:hypothetical protein [Thermoanaerobaculales bacterium]
MRYALLCVESTCGAVFDAEEYPDARCPYCGSEGVSVRAEADKATARIAALKARVAELEAKQTRRVKR